MDVMCPHHRVIQIEKILGVMLYKHPNGEYCSLLNKFVVSAERMLTESVNSGDMPDNLETRVALKISPPARWKLYKRASKTHDATEVRRLFQLAIDACGWNAIRAEIEDVFGYNGFINAELIMGQEIQYPEFTGRPRLSVIAIGDPLPRAIDIAMGEIASQLNGQRRRESLAKSFETIQQPTQGGGSLGSGRVK